MAYAVCRIRLGGAEFRIGILKIRNFQLEHLFFRIGTFPNNFTNIMFWQKLDIMDIFI